MKCLRSYLKLLPLVCFSFLILIACQPNWTNPEEASISPVSAFPLDQVSLLEGPFLHAQELNIDMLLSFDVDRLLARFRSEAGLKPKAESYGGWESMTLAGHSLGHHLSACAMMHQSTNDPRFLQRVNYIIEELSEVQSANGNGYIGAAPGAMRIFEDEIAKGNIVSQSFDLNGIWAPHYTYHKILAGLRDAYRLSGNPEALQISRGFADWLEQVIGDLSHEQLQNMLNCEFGGIQETLVDLYVDTQNEKYLTLSKRFHHDAVNNPLAAANDILSGIHGNTQIPKLIAATKLYEVTDEETYLEQARFFWDRVVNHHSYVTGGHGNHEYFGDPDILTHRLSTETTETCNVYNMLKLSKELFSINPRADISEFYERALYNHIMAAQHPETGQVLYFLSLERGGHKHYEDPMGFTCCVGSGMETHSKHAEHIYFANANDLYVTQFIASELDWKEKKIKVRQETGFPDAQFTALTIRADKPTSFRLMMRYPSWAEKGISLNVNGKKQSVSSQPGSYIAIQREWSDGDKVILEFPFTLRLESMPDDQSRVGIFYGPLVLAGLLGPENDSLAYSQGYVPDIVSDSPDPMDWLQPNSNLSNTFQLAGVGYPRDVVLQPLYKTHDTTYTVYFDTYNSSTWQKHLEELDTQDEVLKELDGRTLDLLVAGEVTDEEKHNLKGDKLNHRQNFKGRTARGSERGGWLSFEMRVDSQKPMDLVIEYWGGFTGSKTFDILIDGEKVATENISGKKDGYFFRESYPIPETRSMISEKVIVSFMPHVGHRSGPFFEARTVFRG